MTTTEVEAYLHRHIPISAAMGVRVLVCDPIGVTLGAPLGPNINHRSTVFGGSASAVAILSAWTWLHFALRAAGQPSRLVIQGNTMDYIAPITGNFESRCEAPPAVTMEKFVRTLSRHGKSRIAVAATLRCEGTKVATFSGEYVALKLDHASELAQS